MKKYCGRSRSLQRINVMKKELGLIAAAIARMFGFPSYLVSMQMAGGWSSGAQAQGNEGSGPGISTSGEE